MNKRYQVFVSSTYEDLKEERAKVIQALWELDCIPYGMEVFPATNTTSWEWIEKMIKESDYFVLVVGGKNGSIEKNSGMSYTRKEYEYALFNKIPTISFIVKDEQNLPANKTERSVAAIRKLDEFRDLVKKNQCRFYSSSDDLKAQVATSLQRLIKDYPREGWVRAHYVSNTEVNGSKSKMKKWELPNGDDQFVWGFVVYYKLKNKRYGVWDDGEHIPMVLKLTWNELLYNVGYYFMEKNNAPLPLYSCQSIYFSPMFNSKIKSLLKQKDIQSTDVHFDKEMIQTVMLKLIEFNCVTLVHDSWKLTTTGMKYYSALKDKFE
jgi:hypothetical protein